MPDEPLEERAAEPAGALDAALEAAFARAAVRLRAAAPTLDPVARAFGEAGHEVAVVGGWVRDLFLVRDGADGDVDSADADGGRVRGADAGSGDIDLATDARPERSAALLRDLTEAVWEVGAAFGTVGARLAGRDVEVTTYRADAYDPGSRKPRVAYGDTLAGDLARRDFTINAMALRLPPRGGPPLDAAEFGRAFEDPYDGLRDLARGVLRTPGTPEVSFSDDPLRMLRACRFAAQLGVRVAPEVRAAMTAMAERLAIVSAERIREEVVRMLLASDPVRGLRLLVETGLADQVLPELPALQLEIDEHHRHKDVYEHSLTVLEQAIELEAARLGGPDLVVRLAALLHDIGKPRTRRFEPGGGVSFHHHDVVGAKLARKRLTALRFGREVSEEVAQLVELHLRFHGYGGGEWTDSAVRRYVRDAGDQLPRLHVLTRADCTTRNARRAAALRRSYDDLERRIAVLSEAERLDALRPDLDGTQIMAALGVPPGPVVGRAYRHLLELRIEHGPLGEAAARAELLRWWADQSESGGVR